MANMTSNNETTAQFDPSTSQRDYSEEQHCLVYE